jgi:hypothetical protein
MVKRIVLAALCLAWLAPVAVADAQEAATIVLRSGERVSGQLIDHGGAGFTISVNGQNRTIPTHDAIWIEFAGSAEPAWSADLTAKLQQGRHVIWLRNGQAVVGSFYDIGGTSPLRITVDTESGRRDYSSNEVARIYLAPPSGSGIGTTGAQPGEPGSIVVPANRQWVPTGIIVRKGEVVTFRATGEIQLSQDPNDKAQPEGAYSQRRAPNSPLSQEFAGALIGRIDNNPPFAISRSSRIPMPQSGQLYLGINDDSLADNSGQFTVTVERRVDRRRRR